MKVGERMPRDDGGRDGFAAFRRRGGGGLTGVRITDDGGNPVALPQQRAAGPPHDGQPRPLIYTDEGRGGEVGR